jgi:hypothetical protein
MTDLLLPFELAAISLLAVLGSSFLLVGLPGWGLISTALILTCMTVGLRITSANQSALEQVPLSAQGE